ncbi:MAG: AmmeMemoRadiSam system protein B [bacterium]|nr:AmmeMemoRadiSam system protein B [bacterium]
MPRSVVVVLWGVVAGVLGPVAIADEQAAVRPAHLAGSWYPGEPEVLAAELGRLLAADKPATLTEKPVALIAPHAGYRFSAPTAAAAYRCLRGHNYRRVIVLAFSHRAANTYAGVDVPDRLTAYQTPLGNVPIDRAACDALLSGPAFGAHPGIDQGEHSLELQLPFLQQVLGEFQLVPLLVGKMSDADCVEAAKAILPWIDDTTLLVASSDFTHYGPRFGYVPFKDDVARDLRALGEKAAAPILRCDYDGFAAHLAATQDTICGRGPIRLLLRVLSMRGGADGVRVGFDTSGNQTGDWANSVTYQALVLTRPAGTLGKAERGLLLGLARETVGAFLSERSTPNPDPSALLDKIQADGACFVTLQNHGRLRGCIGNMTARGPLYAAVIQNAVSACQDRRFISNPVTAAELDELDIEISYLTPMVRVASPDEIVVGRHGLLIALDGRRGVLLPQVAYERGWSREEFLAQTCRKAGLPLGAWKRPDAEIYSFAAEVFGEQ